MYIWTLNNLIYPYFYFYVIYYIKKDLKNVTGKFFIFENFSDLVQ